MAGEDRICIQQYRNGEFTALETAVPLLHTDMAIKEQLGCGLLKHWSTASIAISLYEPAEGGRFVVMVQIGKTKEVITFDRSLDLVTFLKPYLDFISASNALERS